MGILADGQKIMFIGDSITDVGRRGAAFPLGDGYVRLFRELAIAAHPEWELTIINKGIGGNTVEDLWNRWDDDCLRHEPDVLSILIGINDLHRTLFNRDFPVPPDRFAELYASILQRAMDECSPRTILLSPFYISRDSHEGSNRAKVLAVLPDYIAVVKDMSERFGTAFVDLHELFQRHLATREPDEYCPEPVHPHRTGHLVIANAVLATLDGS